MSPWSCCLKQHQIVSVTCCSQQEGLDREISIKCDQITPKRPHRLEIKSIFSFLEITFWSRRLWLLNERTHTRDSLHYLMLTFNLIVVSSRWIRRGSVIIIVWLLIGCGPSMCTVQCVRRFRVILKESTS